MKNRLTKLKHYGDYAVPYGSWFKYKTKRGKLVTMRELNRLAEYEDTGLSPEEVMMLQSETAELKARLEKAVELPLKAGEKGFIYGSYKEIDDTTQFYLSEVTVEGFLDERHRGGNLWYLVLDNGDSIDVAAEDLCLTREEAEVRLKELEEK